MPYQSPIDFSVALDADAPPLIFDYDGAPSALDREASPMQFQFAEDHRLIIGDREWRLVQLHWHVPAEHTVDGAGAAMELHLVHRDADEELAVFGIRYQLGEANAALQSLIDAAQSGLDGQSVVARTLLPAEQRYWHYTGSLTAEPFHEPVLWYVSAAAPTLSPDQCESLRRLADGPNAREIQPRNGRPVLACTGITIRPNRP